LVSSSEEAKASSKSAAIYAASYGAINGSAGLTGSDAFGNSVEVLPFLAFFLFFFLETPPLGVAGASY